MFRTFYSFTMRDSDEDGTNTSDVVTRFETISLDTLAEKFFWFLQAVGFTYVRKVTIHKEGGGTAEFGSQ